MQRNDLSRSLVAFDQNSTVVAVVELSLKSWLVSGLVPGVKRQPLKKLTADPEHLLALLGRWRNEAIKAGHAIDRIAVAFEAGRDGFWLARWLRARGIEARRAVTTVLSGPAGGVPARRHAGRSCRAQRCSVPR